MQIYQFLLTYFLKKHHKVRIQSIKIASLLRMTYYLQLTSLLLGTRQKISGVPTQFNILNIFYYINQICRPYSLLLDLPTFRLYAFLIPLITHSIISAELWEKFFYWVFFKKENKSKQKANFKQFNTTLSIIFQIYFFTLALYSVDLYTVSIIESLNNLTQYIGIFIVSIGFGFREIVFIMLNLQCSESIHFHSSPLHLDDINQFHYYTLLLIFGSIFLNHYNQSQNQIQIAFHILNILIFLFQLFQEVKRTNTYYQKGSMIILTYGFLYNISFFIANQQEMYQIQIVYIFSPFIIHLFNHLQDFFTKLNFSNTRNINSIYNNLLLLYQYKVQEITQLFALHIFQKSVEDIFYNELLLFNSKIIKCNKQDKVYWYQKYIVIKYALNNLTETIYLIHQFQQGNLYFELNKQFIKAQTQLSYIQNLKLKRILKEILRLIYSNLQKQRKEMSFNFIFYNIQVSSWQNKVADLFQRKEQLYRDLLEKKNYPQNALFCLYYNLTQDSINILDALTNELKLHKTYRIQQMLIIFQADFFNNIQQAEQLKYIQLTNEDTRQSIYEQMEYVSLRVENDMKNISIIDYSPNFATMLGYKESRRGFDSIIFSDLIPVEFMEEHQKLVSNFLISGNCRLFDEISNILIRGFDNRFSLCQFSLSLQPFNQSGLHFYAHVKNVNLQPKCIYINKDGLIVGFTNSIQNLLYKKSNIDLKLFYKCDIDSLIPNFSKLIFHKFIRIHFKDNLEEHVVSVQEKLNLTELSIVKNEEALNQEVISIEKEGSNNTELINQESIIIMPKQFYEDILSPISIDHQNKPSQELIRTDTKKIITIKSAENSESNSMLKQNDQKSKKNKSVQEIEELNNDQASSKYSRGFLDNSIYFQKYNQLNTFLSQYNKSIYVKVLYSLLGIGILINIIMQIISAVVFLPKYKGAQSDTDMLTLKSNFITPLYNCGSAQVCSVSYGLLAYYYFEIDADIEIKVVQFANDAINKSYESLKDKFTTQLNNQNLQDFFYNQQFEIEQVYNNSLIQRNISLKSVLYSYEEAQYYVSFLTYLDVLSQNPSNEFTYFVGNLMNLDYYFDELSSSVKDYVLTNSYQFSIDQTKFFLKMAFLELFFIILYLSFSLQSYNQFAIYFNLFTNLNIYAITKEINKLVLINQLLKIQDDQFYSYILEVPKREKEISSQQVEYNKRKQYLSGFEYKPPKLRVLLLYLFLAIGFVLPQIIMQQLNNDFFYKYQNSCILLEQLSQLSSAVTQVYSTKDINYWINLQSPFFAIFTDEKRIQQNEKILIELDKINSFIETFPQLDISNLLQSDNFEEIINNMQTQNICNFVTTFSKTLAEAHCEVVYNGVMKLGLFNTLSEIYKQITLEYVNTNGFEIAYRTGNASYEEIEIGLITSDVVTYLQNVLHDGIISQTQTILIAQEILISCYLILNLLFGTVFLLFHQPFLLKNMYIVRNMILMVPSYQFYLDQKFESNIRISIIKNK